ncbi:hypothetical protein NQ318_017691 [Aromia moschata]|uniref:BZIP domain-containing protein n=1 Tax=Aromia moschata TaxID=1265417 RepID=A0AAV8Y130_9CUCU|nr:hypothetical protein NQ318_017691 [Aromia moschata]
MPGERTETDSCGRFYLLNAQCGLPVSIPGYAYSRGRYHPYRYLPATAIVTDTGPLPHLFALRFKHNTLYDQEVHNITAVLKMCQKETVDILNCDFVLTPEDEERRRRRRERNKIAATKCRLKKRERTANLVHESESLETQNIELKNQLQELQNQKQSLVEMLSLHRPQCQHNIGPIGRDHLYKLPPVSSVMETHSYSRPCSAETNFRNQHLEVYSSRPASVGCSNSLPHTRPSYSKPPSIIVEELNDHYELVVHHEMNYKINIIYTICMQLLQGRQKTKYKLDDKYDQEI